MLASNVSVSVQLDNDSVCGGDVLTGTVHVTVVEPVGCTDVRVTLSGKEYLRWRETEDGVDKYHTNDSKPIDTTVVVAEFDGEIQPGEHAYPFTIELPEDLPGQFSFHDDTYEMWVRYQIEAVALVKGSFARTEKHVSIYQRPPSQKLKPSHDSGRRMVYFLCCIKRGTCKMTASLDQATYHPGETAIAHIRIKNDSQVDVRMLRCRIVQDMTVVKYSSKSHVTKVVALTELAGIPVGQAATYNEDIVIATKDVKAIPVSMRGTLFECSYRLELECDVPWCPDFELHLPMTLVAPSSDQRKSGVIVHGTAFPDVA